MVACYHLCTFNFFSEFLSLRRSTFKRISPMILNFSHLSSLSITSQSRFSKKQATLFPSLSFILSLTQGTCFPCGLWTAVSCLGRPLNYQIDDCAFIFITPGLFAELGTGRLWLTRFSPSLLSSTSFLWPPPNSAHTAVPPWLLSSIPGVDPCLWAEDSSAGMTIPGLSWVLGGRYICSVGCYIWRSHWYLNFLSLDILPSAHTPKISSSFFSLCHDY